MCVRTKWLVLWSLWAARLVPQPTATVRVSNGLLRGAVAHDGSHLQFFGIPYAATDTEHRFQNPNPEPKWEGVFDAYNEHVRCFQRFSPTRISGREDCLTLNVYTPNNYDSIRPVMVFIHGGGFRDGSASPFMYGSEYLIKHGVVLVTINYRLEVLGFLCLGIKEAPGNVGLKDQVAALRWIKTNIRAFGGDPDNITIFGESAGSASVMYHMLTPMSRGLFNKAILQSGSAITPWSFQFEPLKTASLLAKSMGVKTEDPHELYKLFANKPAEELLKTRVPRRKGDIVLSENIFVPCVDKEIKGMERFLPDTPINLISNNQYQKVPVIIGFNNAEGYLFAGKENETTLANFNIYNALPRDLIFPTEDEKNDTVDRLKGLYSIRRPEDYLKNIAKYEGDTSITYPTIASIDLLSKSTDGLIYAYKLSYDGWLNVPKWYFGFRKYPGAAHADELFYLFKVKVPLVMEFIEIEFINKITTLWTNFAKFGNPTPFPSSTLPVTWKPFKTSDPKILVIDKQFSEERLWSDEVMLYWDTIYTKYRRKL
ncbi:acetylcholinesterase-like [Bombyx mandarina]|uniref:Carboxylic ester hydrolase n=1 Tax=Bombyx mandarina TaxID=7092 RepID=A0A6J2JSL0_BOMMA|nr:acetylcholinesterase-like [Bombyx mandarina]